MRRPSLIPLALLTAALGLQGCTLTRLARQLAPAPERPGRQPGVRRELVFWEAMAARGGGPLLVTLDSAAVYRVEPADGSVMVSPRLASLPAPREVGSLYGDGHVIQPRVSGEHRVDTRGSAEGVVEVRIWREEGDQLERHCIEAPRARGCVGEAWAHGRIPLGLWLMFVAVPVAGLGLVLRNLRP